MSVVTFAFVFVGPTEYGGKHLICALCDWRVDCDGSWVISTLYRGAVTMVIQRKCLQCVYVFAKFFNLY